MMAEIRPHIGDNGLHHWLTAAVD